MEFDLIQMLRELFQNLNAGALFGACFVIYILINILRGKVKLGEKPLKIPWLTDKFNALQKEIKTFLLLSLFGIIGVITTIATGTQLTLWAILDGLLCGLITGATTLGIRSASKQGMEGFKKVKQAIQEKRVEKKGNENKS